MIYKLYVKRLVDIIGSSVVLLILSPIILAITLVLTIVNRGKPFFVQPRPGKNEKVFKLIKFKTMTDRTDVKGALLPDADRMTKIGTIIRRLSLDELPQLVNVLFGHMSLIGPRPLLVEYLSLYSQEQKQRHKMRPGITGWAQVNGRNLLSWEAKFKLDVYYVNNVTLWLDIRIVMKTIMKILRPEGVTSKTSVSMEKFTGNTNNR